MTRSALSAAWQRLDATLAEAPTPSLELLDELDTGTTGTWQPITYFGERIGPYSADRPLPSTSTHSLVCALESASGDVTRDVGRKDCAAAETSAAARVASPGPELVTRSAGGAAANSTDSRTTAARLLSGERRVSGSGGDACGGAR